MHFAFKITATDTSASVLQRYTKGQKLSKYGKTIDTPNTSD